ncbi:hypothetical protein KO500_00575 [Cellulophaga baltica]|uniref:hypothetical protein n=1 Tax=Cellulophaga TaxID=104264 RepID=UPI001C07AF57|nr:MULTISPECIES: hypothetical protein [Cellulophaga]MBU2994906.1 hypothetical protein [Cellulophaga baltica]MDO6766300.1 hypothetical protein [Cellulophaga sp. 1_MG-2023]
MKKLTLVIAFFAMGFMSINAQSNYNTAVGLGLDFGSGFTFVGPSAKFFIAPESAIEGEILFESGVTALTGLYEYHGSIEGAEGLNWFAGGGASILFFSGDTELALRPTVGLEYKNATVPLVFSFDWRPFLGLGDLTTEVGAFGLGIRYVIN